MINETSVLSQCFIITLPPSIKPLVLMITDRIDVFLSRKSQDAHLAKEVYDFLTSKGLQVFDSDHSLLEMGNSDYSRAIDDALVKTNHLIVIGSSVENITSSWVEAEWRFFLNRKRANKTKGNILTVVTKTVAIDDLPPSLQNYEVITFEQKNTKILPYVMVGHIKEMIVEEKIGETVVEIPKKPKTVLKEKVKKVEKPIVVNDPLIEPINGYKDILTKWQKSFWYIPIVICSSTLLLSFIYSISQYKEAYSTVDSVVVDTTLIFPTEDSTKAIHYASLSDIELEQKANEGIAKAQYWLGYRNKTKGYYNMAFRWYLKAAKQGNAYAQNDIGVLFKNGFGVEKDYAQAMLWYLKASEQGNDAAQGNIGALYFNGQGVPQDKETAKEWFLKAASQGDESAKNWLKDEYNITNY
jgi:hypothetical protein